MSKYDPLGAYLKAQRLSHIPMTFEEIERVIGFSLPPVANGNRAWWSNSPTNNVMTTVWIDAGFKTEQVDMASRRLVFRRRGDASPPSSSTPRAPTPPPLPSSGARRDHRLFGCLKGTVTLSADLDLTAPADPAWGAGDR